MIKNGRYYLQPEEVGVDFKELFGRLAARGAGRPVDKDGFPSGPWTPELLADAISEIQVNSSGIDLRTVQLWFQQNDKGVSADNIRWLARVFGCDDPEATSEWQLELTAAQSRLAAKRREQKKTGTAVAPSVAVATGEKTRRSFAERCEALLSGEGAVILLISYWFVYSGLGLMNYLLGTFSVTYSPIEGLDKQVGFIWAPTLTILPAIVLPLYILSVSHLIGYWKNEARAQFVFHDVSQDEPDVVGGWLAKVRSFSFPVWSIWAFCIVFVFGMQWGGIYLPAYASGDAGEVQIDRYLVALSRPEVITIPKARVLSAFGYCYSASYIVVFMLGLLFVVIATLDYHSLSRSYSIRIGRAMGKKAQAAGHRVLWGGFRIAVYGLWIAILLKLQIVYLSSDGVDFVSWMLTDAQDALGGTNRNGFLDNESVVHFTTFLMMVVVVAVFGFCLINVRRTLKQEHRYNLVHLTMVVVLILLSANLLLVGEIVGFSLLTALSAVVSCYTALGPKLKST